SGADEDATADRDSLLALQTHRRLNHTGRAEGRETACGADRVPLRVRARAQPDESQEPSAECPPRAAHEPLRSSAPASAAAPIGRLSPSMSVAGALADRSRSIAAAPSARCTSPVAASV